MQDKEQATATTELLSECAESFRKDFCPYQGAPDPWIVWQAAWKAAMHASNGQAPAPAVKKWAPEEVEDGERGIRWVTNDGIHGRPTDHDVREYLKRTPTASGCLCDECKVFYAGSVLPSMSADEVKNLPTTASA